MADYTLTIRADSGYESTTEGRCNADQYAQAIGALHGRQDAELAALRAECARKDAALKLARDMIATERQCFADCNVVPELTAGDDGLYVNKGGALFAPEDAEVIEDYDRVLAAIDAALAAQTQEQT